ncbi:MAG TPA: GldG family protein [Oligoflexia bacterium]|nr:GldG family protein [Oligoflexia bacterium]HMR24398.1 GldG family protein [Oligoflexia bacterium]
MNTLSLMSGVTGFVLLLGAILGYGITKDSSNWFFRSLMIFSVLFLVYYLVMNIKYLMKSPGGIKNAFSDKKNQGRLGNAIFILLVVCCLAVVNVISTKTMFWKKDFTQNEINTLSDQTLSTLKQLDKPIKIQVFMFENNQLKPGLKNLLQYYQDASDQVKVEFKDPDVAKLDAQKISAQDGDILIEYGEQQHIMQGSTEQDITQAILKVTRNGETMVCFTEGHGELKFEGDPQDPRSLSFIKPGLSNEGFNARTLSNLLPKIDEACSIVIIAGPQVAFTANEVISLNEYLLSGGKVQLLLDPNISTVVGQKNKVRLVDNGLKDFLHSWGVVLGDNVILEKRLSLQGMQITTELVVANYGQHPIVEPLKQGMNGNLNTEFDQVRSVNKAPGFEGTVVELAFTSPGENSWAQSDLQALFIDKKPVIEATDQVGKVSIGLVSEKDLEIKVEGDNDPEIKQAQLVVWGDSDFISNAMVGQNRYNYDLFINALNFLRGEVEQITIRPKLIKSSAIELSATQSIVIFYLSIIILPMLVLLFGLNLWLYRKRLG